jgi:hypothetical protein
VSYADIQKQGNLAYHQLSNKEREKYEAMAATVNENLTTSSFGTLTKEKMIKRIIKNIESNVSFTTTNSSNCRTLHNLSYFLYLLYRLVNWKS